jgi:hypothetical protein
MGRRAESRGGRHPCVIDYRAHGFGEHRRRRGLAITSALPNLNLDPSGLSLGFVALLMVGNLRGVRESGRLFSVADLLFLSASS